MNAFNKIKQLAENKETYELVQAVTILSNKSSLEVHERLTNAAMCDVIEEREGTEFIETLLDSITR